MTLRNRVNSLLEYELPILLLITLGAMAVQSLLIVALAMVFFCFAIRFLVQIRRWQVVITPIDLPLIGIWLLLPVTWWITIDRETTGWQILRLLNGISLFYAVIRWFSNGALLAKLYKLILSCEVIGVVVVAMGLVSTKWPVGKSNLFDYIYQYLLGFSSASVHPNVLAGTIILFLPIPLVFFFLPLVAPLHKAPAVVPSLQLGWLVWQGVALFVLLTGIVLTQSRGGMLGLVVAIFVLVFILTGNKGRLLLFGMSVSVVLAALLFPHDFLTLLSGMVSDSAISTSAIRLEVWSRAYYMIQDFPFTGIGMGNFRTVLELMYPLFLTTEIIPHAHNLFLQIATDLGLIGLICWLAIAIFIIFSLCTVIKRNARCFDQPYALLQYQFAVALLGSQIALLTHGLFDAVAWGGVRTAPFVWLLWGIAIALYLPNPVDSTS